MQFPGIIPGNTLHHPLSNVIARYNWSMLIFPCREKHKCHLSVSLIFNIVHKSPRKYKNNMKWATTIQQYDYIISVSCGIHVQKLLKYFSEPLFHRLTSSFMMMNVGFVVNFESILPEPVWRGKCSMVQLIWIKPPLKKNKNTVNALF